MNNSNPYFSGIDQAMMLNERYRKPTLEQQYDSLNAALATMAANMGQSNIGGRKGFLGNLASLAPSISQSVQAYNVGNKNAEAENLAMLKEAKHDEQVRQTLAAKEQSRNDKNFWARRQDEWRQSKEDRQIKNDANRLLYQAEKLKALQNKNEENKKTVKTEYGTFSKADPVTIRGLKKEAKAAGVAKVAADQVVNEMETIEAEQANNITAPFSKPGQIVNTIKGTLGDYFNIPEFKKEVGEVNATKSDIKNISASAERTLKGGGQLGLGFYEVMKNNFPNPDTDGDVQLQIKMNKLKATMDDFYAASKFAADHGIDLTMPEWIERKNRNNANNMPLAITDNLGAPQVIRFFDPNSQKIYDIPSSEANDVPRHWVRQ